MDSIKIESLTQTKGGGIVMSFVCFEKGEDIGSYSMSWRTAEELDLFLGQVTLNELIRSALTGIYTQETKELDTSFLIGKTLDTKAPMAEKVADPVEIKL